MTKGIFQNNFSDWLDFFEIVIKMHEDDDYFLSQDWVNYFSILVLKLFQLDRHVCCDLEYSEGRTVTKSANLQLLRVTI